MPQRLSPLDESSALQRRLEIELTARLDESEQPTDVESRTPMARVRLLVGERCRCRIGALEGAAAAVIDR
jgi:hypothetical protein